jgi:hypothetical protein
MPATAEEEEEEEEEEEVFIAVSHRNDARKILNLLLL